MVSNLPFDVERFGLCFQLRFDVGSDFEAIQRDASRPFQLGKDIEHFASQLLIHFGVGSFDGTSDSPFLTIIFDSNEICSLDVGARSHQFCEAGSEIFGNTVVLIFDNRYLPRMTEIFIPRARNLSEGRSVL